MVCVGGVEEVNRFAFREKEQSGNTREGEQLKKAGPVDKHPRRVCAGVKSEKRAALLHSSVISSPEFAPSLIPHDAYLRVFYCKREYHPCGM